MTKRIDVQDGTGILAQVPGLGVIFAYGSTVPSDNTAGYAPACIFLDTNANSVNTVLYVNIGNATLCNFDVLKG